MMKTDRTYRFYGHETADVPPADETFAALQTPRDLYDALLPLWTRDTCAPRLQKDWSADNPTLGQCSITAFLVQDIFGGRVYGIPMPGGNFHCYNVVDGCTFDLTSEQFLPEVLQYGDDPEQTRETHFAKEEKRRRYETLRRRLLDVLHTS